MPIIELHLEFNQGSGLSSCTVRNNLLGVWQVASYTFIHIPLAYRFSIINSWNEEECNMMLVTDISYKAVTFIWPWRSVIS